MRRVLLAHHTALIGRPDMETWIDRGAHELRSLFGLAQRYRLAGVSRDDMAANNARAREAIDKFGTPPSKILEGSHRSQFAPPITRGTSEPLPAGSDQHDQPEVEALPEPEEPAEGGEA